MRYAQARLPIAHQSVPKQVALAQAVLNHAGSNADFGESDPLFQNLAQETAALHESDRQVALRRAELKAAMTERDEQRVRFRKAAAVYVSHINAKAKGDPSVITEAGLDVSRAPSPSREPDAPMIQHAIAGLSPGELRLRWPRVAGAVSYQIERALSYEGPYTHVSSNTTCSVRLQNQPTNVELWYRVQATGAGGTGPFSTPVPTLLPQHTATGGPGPGG